MTTMICNSTKLYNKETLSSYIDLRIIHLIALYRPIKYVNLLAFPRGPSSYGQISCYFVTGTRLTVEKSYEDELANVKEKNRSLREKAQKLKEEMKQYIPPGRVLIPPDRIS
ncbi:predicted protein [Sclerotinia sclerotiorum 1980 UF-70]|uniref:Uncharacterized protein n=1 Tax=Sclerotinia sclerotiorum (strain ATCC 18683 / 1980 / Ss-1) TaxID=665079 RepID=A7EJX1_SCLS1|nr:predicted protein [Sclerotinia sclerotiorum 1980 UF-70]EDO03137.1 predicted protein [Sclerotinia sclerotiorum 1980 UF-70]